MAFAQAGGLVWPLKCGVEVAIFAIGLSLWRSSLQPKISILPFICIARTGTLICQD